MRKNEINGVMNDLLKINILYHPLDHFSKIDDVEVDLLKMQINYPDEDSVYDFYKKKIKWFNDRTKRLNGFRDFQSAKIFVSGRKERIEIIFKNKNFSKEQIFEEAALPEGTMKSMKLKQAIRALKPSCDVSKK